MQHWGVLSAIIVALTACSAAPPSSEGESAARSSELEALEPVPGLHLDPQLPPPNEPGEEPDGDALVIAHPGQFSSLQAAVDGAPDGAEIRLAAGTHYEGIVLAGKSLTIAGAGAATTRLDGANVFGPLVTLRAGAHLRLRGLALASPYDAIASTVEVARPAGGRPRLDMREIFVAGARSGIQGSFQRVVIRRSAFSDLSEAGLMLSSTPKVILDGVEVEALKTGLFIDNRKEASTCITRVSDSTIRGREKGGLIVLGSKTTVYVERVKVHDSTFAGIGLFGVRAATLSSVRVERTERRPDGTFGNGLVVWGSSATLTDSTITRSAGAGIFAIGCPGTSGASSLAMARTTLTCNGLDLSVHSLDEVMSDVTCGSGPSVALDDVGGNACSQAADASCETELGPCKAQPSTLAPTIPY